MSTSDDCITQILDNKVMDLTYGNDITHYNDILREPKSNHRMRFDPADHGILPNNFNNPTDSAQPVFAFTEDELVELQILRDQETDALVERGLIQINDR